MPAERTDNRNLQSVEDPSDPEPNDHEKVKTAQGQPVEPERDIRLNDRGREDRLLHFRRSIVGAADQAE